ncbi:hypothetical protein PQX77_004496 [Marasmius sp. AFHP31]|nr:hypothetical protein PQX77_004496 [Marasmius sp. AFHP31]
MPNPPLSDIDKSSIIVVLGATGSGKTTFVNTASGSSLQVGSDLEPCTTSVQLSQPFVVNGREIRLVDTPGDEDADALKQITDFLAGVYEQKITLLGLLYLQNISSPRIGGLSRRNMRIFRDICGEAAMKRVIIVTTGIDKESDMREAELQANPKFFRAAIQEGARLVRYDGTVESAKDIIVQLANNVAEDITSLRIQEELIDLGMGLSESAVGVQLDRELVRELENHEKAMRGEIEWFNVFNSLTIHKDLRSSIDSNSLAKLGLRTEVAELRALVTLAEVERDEIAEEYHGLESTQGLSPLHALILATTMLMALWLL